MDPLLSLPVVPILLLVPSKLLHEEGFFPERRLEGKRGLGRERRGEWKGIYTNMFLKKGGREGKEENSVNIKEKKGKEKKEKNIFIHWVGSKVQKEINAC